VALPVELRDRIDSRLRPLRETTTGVRWTRAEGLHLTARFIGSVDPERIAEIEAVMRDVAPARTPFRAALGDVGTFGGKRKPRVAWIGLAAGWRELGELEVALSARLERLEHRPRFGGPANRPSPPHITIARAVPNGLDVEIRRRLLDLRGIEWTADGLSLFRSHLGPGGSVYEELTTVPFGR
jgi:2'-5' RNA ligase